MSPMILCVEMDPGKLMRVSLLASSLGIRTAEVKRDRQGMLLGALCGIDPAGKEKAGKVPGEMLVMAHFPDALADRFLKALRESGCGVALKAMLTPYNRFWTCERLFRELTREAAAMGGKAK